MIAGNQDSLSISKAPPSDESFLDKQSTIATIGLQHNSLTEDQLTDSSDGFLSQQQTPRHHPHMVKNVSRNIPQFVPKIASNWLFYDDISPLSRRIPPTEGSLTINIPQLNYRLNCEKFVGYMAAKSCSSTVSTPHSVTTPVNELYVVRTKLKQQKHKEAVLLGTYQFLTESEFKGLMVSTSAPQLAISQKNNTFTVCIDAGSQESTTILHLNRTPLGRICVKRDELQTPVFEGFEVEETTIVAGEGVCVEIKQKESKKVVVQVKTSVIQF